MKKGEIYEGTVKKLLFPNKGIVFAEEGGQVYRIILKNVLPGQKVRFVVKKKRNGKVEARLKEILEKSPLEMEAPACPHYGFCGGCVYQSLPYEEQIRLKRGQVLDLLRPVLPEAEEVFEGILPCPAESGYRNKMEFTFGDEYKGGPLSLGMHARGSFYDIATVDRCRIMDEDFRKILGATLEYFRLKKVSYYHRQQHTGYLRNLVVRKAQASGGILAVLVTSSQLSAVPAEEGDGGGSSAGLAAAGVPAGEGSGPAEEKAGPGARQIFSEEELLAGWKEKILSLPLEGKIDGVLHTRNDSLADAVRDEGTKVLYGRDYIEEKLLGLTFKITPFSFFQTNSRGAEVLYQTVRRYVGEEGSDIQETNSRKEEGIPERKREAREKESLEKGRGGNEEGGDFHSVLAEGNSRVRIGPQDEQSVRKHREGKVVFDLYSGTGTIAQILAPEAEKVVGVEIVEEAVRAARENAAQNGLENCSFIAGDVLKVLDEIPEKPDLIVLDPPREGVHPKALQKIIAYGAERIIYVSCKPTSLANDLKALLAGGYKVERFCCLDQFPGTANVETILSLSIKNRKLDAYIDVSLDMDDYRRIIGDEE